MYPDCRLIVCVCVCDNSHECCEIWITEISIRGKISLERSPSGIQRCKTAALKLICIELCILDALIDNIIEF